MHACLSKPVTMCCLYPHTPPVISMCPESRSRRSRRTLFITINEHFSLNYICPRHGWGDIALFSSFFFCLTLFPQQTYLPVPACVLFLSNCCWTTTALPVQALVPWPLSTFVWQSPPLPANQHMAACPHLLTGQPGLSSNYASSLGLFLDPDTNYMHKLASFNRGRGSSSEVALWASNRWTRVRLPAKLDGCFMPCIASLPWSLPLKLPLWHQCVSTGIAKERRQCTREYHFPFSHLCTILSCLPVFLSSCLPIPP